MVNSESFRLRAQCWHWRFYSSKNVFTRIAGVFIMTSDGAVSKEARRSALFVQCVDISVVIPVFVICHVILKPSPHVTPLHARAAWYIPSHILLIKYYLFKHMYFILFTSATAPTLSWPHLFSVYPKLSGLLLLGGDTEGRVHFWNIKTGEAEAAVSVHQSPVNAITYHKGRFYTGSR